MSKAEKGRWLSPRRAEEAELELHQGLGAPPLTPAHNPMAGYEVCQHHRWFSLRSHLRHYCYKTDPKVL